ncbi:MAG: ABC transporter permease subunit [Longimicrobiales bacterium]|nr:ABC transporter permease subunit [Longimicrobiales bacterium]
MLNRADVWTLYRRELRSAFRERTIVVNSILMPIFLYPVLLWVMFTAQTYIQGLNEGFTSRIALVDPVPADHASVLDSLRGREGVRLRGDPEEETPTGPPDILIESEALALLRSGAVDAVVGFRPPEGAGSTLPGNFRVQVRFDGTESRSERARDRVESVLAGYRDTWVQREAERLGMGVEDRVRFLVDVESVSTSREMGTMILGQMLSFFLIIMVALGCFVPSVDTTAGERERSTWETLMTVAASRASVVTAKYLYVATLGIAAGVLNVTAVFLSVGAVLRPLLQGSGEEITFSIPLAAVPVMLAGAVALALFFSAAMMLLASFARSFKDGQALVQPVYWLVFLPLLLGQQTDRTLTPAIASVPVANVSMMIRDAINGVFLWPLIAWTLVVTLATVALALTGARFALRFEDFLLGSFDGSFWRFVRDRISRRRRTDHTTEAGR